MDGWKTIDSFFGNGPISGAFAVSFREGTSGGLVNPYNLNSFHVPKKPDMTPADDQWSFLVPLIGGR